MNYFSLLGLSEDDINSGNFGQINNEPTLDNINDDIIEEPEIIEEKPLDKKELLIIAMQDASEELGLEFVCAKNDRHYILKDGCKLFDNDIVQNMMDEVIEVADVINEAPTSTAKKVIESYAEMQGINIEQDIKDTEVEINYEEPTTKIVEGLIGYNELSNLSRDLSNLLFDRYDADIEFEITDDGKLMCDADIFDNIDTVVEDIKEFINNSNYSANVTDISYANGEKMIVIDEIEESDIIEENIKEMPIYNTINENLNEMDKRTSNKYDLLNTYLSSKCTLAENKNIANMIIKRKSPKEIYECLLGE